MTDPLPNDSHVDPVQMANLARSVYFDSLSSLMHEASERCYHAGEIIGMETEIPPRAYRAMSTGKPVEWGGDWIYPAEGAAMIALAEALGMKRELWDTRHTHDG